MRLPVRLAASLGVDLEAIYLANRDLASLAAFDFAREVPLSGDVRQALTAENLAATFRVEAAALHRELSASAWEAGVATRERTLAGDPVAALARAVAERDEPAIVALAMAATIETAPRMAAILAAAPGVVAVASPGRRGDVAAGPVIAVVDEPQSAIRMIDAARFFASVTGSEPRHLVCANAEDAARLEGELRLALAAGRPATLDVLALAPQAAEERLVETLYDMGASLVVVRYGGLLCPPDVGPAAVIDGAEAGVVVVR